MSNSSGFSELGRVRWWPTLRLALGRGFATGLVGAVILPLLNGGPYAQEAVMIPLYWTVLAVPTAMMLTLIAKGFGAVVPIMGAGVMIVASLFVCLGDPLVYVINRTFPRLFGIADFKFFNFSPLLYILSPD